MKEFTQSVTGERGNCWQTAVACILEVEPDELPSQFDSYALTERNGKPYWDLKYNNILQRYLLTHHNLAYVEFHYPREAFEQINISGLHILTGTTVRSAELNGSRHVVVGKDGKTVWDPHPSRAGLLSDILWAVLCPFPEAWKKSWEAREDKCICPACKS